MYKLIHRLLTIIISFSMFFLIVFLMRELPLPSVVVFILGVPIIFFPVAMFQKVSFMCDQKGCAGTAELELNFNLHDKWYRHFLISGHRCNQCQHFIKMPKGQRRRI